jgi:hypothetical protein
MSNLSIPGVEIFDNAGSLSIAGVRVVEYSTGSNRTVSCNAEVLGVTGQAATVYRGRLVSSALEQIGLNDLNGTVNRSRYVSASVEQIGVSGLDVSFGGLQLACAREQLGVAGKAATVAFTQTRFTSSPGAKSPARRTGTISTGRVSTGKVGRA